MQRRELNSAVGKTRVNDAQFGDTPFVCQRVKFCFHLFNQFPLLARLMMKNVRVCSMAERKSRCGGDHTDPRNRQETDEKRIMSYGQASGIAHAITCDIGNSLDRHRFLPGLGAMARCLQSN